MEGTDGPIIASSDYVKGMGRSATRPDLRRHFEVDAECIVVATLYQLSQEGKVDAKEVAKAIKDLGVDPEKINPLYA